MGNNLRKINILLTAEGHGQGRENFQIIGSLLKSAMVNEISDDTQNQEEKMNKNFLKNRLTVVLAAAVLSGSFGT